MSRYKLKNNYNPKARNRKFLGGAISAGATLAAAAMQVAATTAAAKTQAKAVEAGAKQQSESIKLQTENNNRLQKENIEFTRQQNEENRQQQQDIQTTLQMMAGKENINDIMESRKMAFKYGGNTKRKSIKSDISYGGTNKPFKVTDGGGAIPLDTNIDGYGLYELYGNDHEHYHKAPGGKNKTGVGIKFEDGSVVEGEGNQNSNKGELLYVTPDDAMFISKHSIDGFNPADAVKEGIHPVEAFNIQEILKQRKGIKDNGNKAKDGKGITYYDDEAGHYVINREKIGDAIHSIIDPIIQPLRNIRERKSLKKPGSFGGGRTGGGGAELLIDNVPTRYEEVNDTTNVLVPVTQTFNDAFKTAREKGEKEFEFNGKIHTTELGDNPNAVEAGNKRTRTTVVPVQIIRKKKVPINDETSPVAKYGTRKSLKRSKALIGKYNPFAGNYSVTPIDSNLPGTNISVMGTPVSSTTSNKPYTAGAKATSGPTGGNNTGGSTFMNNYGGAIMSGGANLLGAGLSVIGNSIAGRTLSKAYNKAGNILADAYSQMKGINLDEIKREDYAAPHTLAVIRSADTNINPQLERIRRNAAAENTAINRGTMSSAARQQKLAGVNDRMLQRMTEQYAYKHNADEQIKQQNAQAITQTAQSNADRDVQANKDYASQRLAVMQYNNDIENAKIAGIGQARADAITQSNTAKANALQTSFNSIGSAINATGSGFASAYDANKKSLKDYNNVMIGVDTENAVRAIIQNPNMYDNKVRARNMWNTWKNSNNATLRGYAEDLNKAYKFS